MHEIDSLRRSLDAATPEEIQAVLAELPEEVAEALLRDWPLWARPNQLTPPGEWFVWLLLWGRGGGKTRTGAEFAIQQAREIPGSHGCLLAETPAQARDVMVQGQGGSSIMECSTSDFRAEFEPTKRLVTWPNGSTAHTYSAFEYEELRGPQYNWAWVDELAKFRWPEEAWDNMLFGLRLPPRARVCVTTTPKPIPLIKRLMKRDTTYVSRGTTYENLSNLDKNFAREILDQYEGTRKGRQELRGEMLEDLEGALWTHDALDGLRTAYPKPDELRRVVVAVDPSGGKEEGNDEQGITVQGITHGGEGVLMDDVSCKLTPAGWGKRVVQAAIQHQADCVVAETNYGGAMVEHVVLTAAQALEVTVRVKVVTASRGKVVRAEPVSALYEQRRVRHAGTFGELEDELCGFTERGYEGDGSPNRADALVWGFTELMLGAGPASYGDLQKTAVAWHRRR